MLSVYTKGLVPRLRKGEMVGIQTLFPFLCPALKSKG